MGPSFFYLILLLLGRWLVAPSKPKTIRVFEVPSLNTMRTLGGHDSLVMSVVFSSDDRFLASGCADNCVRLWSLPSGFLLHVLKGITLNYFLV